MNKNTNEDIVYTTANTACCPQKKYVPTEICLDIVNQSTTETYFSYGLGSPLTVTFFNSDTSSGPAILRVIQRGTLPELITTVQPGNSASLTALRGTSVEINPSGTTNLDGRICIKQFKKVLGVK